MPQERPSFLGASTPEKVVIFYVVIWRRAMACRGLSRRISCGDGVREIFFANISSAAVAQAIGAAQRGRASQMTHRDRRELLVIRKSGGAAGADGRRVAAALLVPA